MKDERSQAGIPVVVFGPEATARKLNLPKDTTCCTDPKQLSQLVRKSPRILVLECLEPVEADFNRIRKLASSLPVRMLVFTNATDDETIERFALTNCMGVLPVGATHEVVRKAISVLQSNEHWLPRRVISRLVRSFVSTGYGKALTKREQEIANLLSQPLNNQEIADRLCISRETVRWHARTIYSKLGISNRRMLRLEPLP